MITLEHMQVSRDKRGRVTASIDHVGIKVNVLSESLWQSIERLLDEVDRDPSIEQLCFRSGKSTSFIVGANLREVDRLVTVAEIETFIARGHQRMERIENLRVPTVAMVEGLCLGGGLEFAMACRHRIALRDETPWFGMPETLIGLIPGWAGTYRLPRLVGLPLALEMLLNAQRLNSAEAQSAGLLDAVADPESWSELVAEFDPLAKPRKECAMTSAVDWRTLSLPFAKADPLQPARDAALRCVQAGIEEGRLGALHAEQHEFAPLFFSDVSKELRGQIIHRPK